MNFIVLIFMFIYWYDYRLIPVNRTTAQGLAVFLLISYYVSFVIGLILLTYIDNIWWFVLSKFCQDFTKLSIALCIYLYIMYRIWYYNVFYFVSLIRWRSNAWYIVLALYRRPTVSCRLVWSIACLILRLTHIVYSNWVTYRTSWCFVRLPGIS